MTSFKDDPFSFMLPPFWAAKKIWSKIRDNEKLKKEVLGKKIVELTHIFCNLLRNDVFHNIF